MGAILHPKKQFAPLKVNLNLALVGVHTLQFLVFYIFRVQIAQIWTDKCELLLSSLLLIGAHFHR